MWQRLSCGGFFLYFFCFVLQVCVGAEAEDKFHMVEIEGLTYDGKSTKVPLAVLKPSIMPSVSAHHKDTNIWSLYDATFVLNTVVKMKSRPLYAII